MKDVGNTTKKKHRKGNSEDNLVESLAEAELEWNRIKGSLGRGKSSDKGSNKASDKSSTKVGGKSSKKARGIGSNNGNDKASHKTNDKVKSNHENRSKVGSVTVSHKSYEGMNPESRKNNSQTMDDKMQSDRKKRIEKESHYHKTDKQSGLHKKSSQNCPKMKSCGGCRMEPDYKTQLLKKQDLVESLLNKYCKVEPIIGMKDPYHYRNKVHAVFDHDRKGNPISGIYEEGTHRVIPIDSCIIHNKKADEIIVSIRNLLKSFKIKTYDEDTGYGLLRHVLVRTGYHSGEIMVVLVLASPIMPSKNNFVKALRKLHPEITTIVVNVNNKATSMVLGDKEQVIYGKGYIEDTLCGKVFRISPKSFYQINPVQTEVIYQKAIELAGLTGQDTVIDAYCGIGTISLIASDHAGKVIGVELNKDAVQDAIENGKRNNVKNTQFYCQDAGEFMDRMASVNESADVVFMDPPRAGSDEKFLSSLCLMKPDRIVYISCNPVTLERDMKVLISKGYRAVTAIPVDMFPWTEHVECCVLMSRNI